MLFIIQLPNSSLLLLLALAFLLTIGLFVFFRREAQTELLLSTSNFLPPTWQKFTGTARLWGILCAMIISWCCLSWTSPFTQLQQASISYEEIEEIVPPVTTHRKTPIPPPPPDPKDFVTVENDDPSLDSLILEPVDVVMADSASAVDTGLTAPPVPPTMPKPEEDVEELPLRIVSQMPRFPGCEELEASTEEKRTCAEKKLLDYIYSKINYPQVALENDVEGTVIVDFIIEKDGTISQVEILRSPGAGTGNEVRKVIESMNFMDARWTPGRQQGRTVRVRFSLPVRFKLK